MQLYDESISELLNYPEIKNSFPQASESVWDTDTGRNMVLRGDMAFELGGELKPSVGCTLVTMDESLVPEDMVTLYGPDLSELQYGMNHPYARVSLVRLNKDIKLEGDQLFKAIRNLEFTRYHFYPKGFMLRISATRNKESVRVSKDAIKNGITFGEVGKTLADAFHKNTDVVAVHTIYVTDPSFSFGLLESLATDCENITKTIDHIFKDGIMDCKSCSLQKVCEEVEGLRELHFAQSNNK